MHRLSFYSTTIMAMEFIGSIVTVTLLQPPNAQARGFVEGITEGQRLDLRDGISWDHYLLTFCADNFGVL